MAAARQINNINARCISQTTCHTAQCIVQVILRILLLMFVSACRDGVMYCNSPTSLISLLLGSTTTIAHRRYPDVQESWKTRHLRASNDRRRCDAGGCIWPCIMRPGRHRREGETNATQLDEDSRRYQSGHAERGTHRLKFVMVCWAERFERFQLPPDLHSV
jgi:hypothetical protein